MGCSQTNVGVLGGGSVNISLYFLLGEQHNADTDGPQLPMSALIKRVAREVAEQYQNSVIAAHKLFVNVVIEL